MRLQLSICLLLALSAPLAAAQSQVLVSTWELKQHVRQLRQDIQLRQASTTQLLDRCSQLFTDHPHHLVAIGNGFLPLQDVIMKDLETQGLLNEWTHYCGAIAEDELKKAGRNMDTLLHVAQHYPATKAARQAWQLLADIAWDQGHLGSYLHYAERSGEQHDALRNGRERAALTLLVKQQHFPVPNELKRVDAIWEEPLPVFKKRTTRSNRNVIVQRNGSYIRNNNASLPYQVSDGDTGVLALSNGTNLIILDPLLGRRLGPIHNLGSNRYGHQSNRAFVGKDMILAIGSDGGHPSVLACNRLGEQLWRTPLDHLTSVLYASRPLALDGLIFVSTIENNNSSERISLHALDQEGNIAWSKVIAQVAGQRNYYRQPIQDMSPDMCIHRGRIALLTNRGVIAQVSSDGIIISLDTYPVKQVDMQFVRRINGERQNNGARISGHIKSNGQQLIATPIDSDNILLHDAKNRGFSAYTGDGQSSTLLDMNDKHALLIDDKIRLLSIEDMQMKWDVQRKQLSTSSPWGRLNDKHCIVAAGTHISTHQLQDGDTVAQIEYPKNHYVTMHNELMVYIGERMVTGRGDSVAFEDNLMQAAQAAPQDYQPRIALAALRRAQGKSMDAYNFLLTAIQLGAPRSYSENAAQILRPHLYLHLNDPAFDEHLAHLNRLIEIDQQFEQEMNWWRARRLETLKKIPEAISLYRQLIKEDARQIKMTNGLQGDLSAIAEASIHRLEEKPAPWLKAKTINTPSSTFPAWHIEGSSPIKPLVSGKYVIGFINGFLRCYDATSGQEIWKQNTDEALAMLGVSVHPSSRPQNDARIMVLNGMCADVIGMKHNDTITKFNDHTINNWTDVIQAVAATKCGAQFTVTVKRGEESIKLSGELGAKPMQATQHNGKTVLCHNINIRTNPRRPGHFIPNPDTINTPFIQIYDIASGELLWHHTQPPKTPIPILTDNDLLIEVHNGDLVARSIRDPEHPIMWTAKGRGHELGMHQLSGHVLISTDHNTSRVFLRDIRTGKQLFNVPANPLYELTLNGDNLLSTLSDGHLAMWELSTADMRWSSQEAYLKPVAIDDKAIFCRSSRDELLRLDRTNGIINRRYPQWSQVYASARNESTLFVACVNQKQQNAIAAVHLASGNVVWEHPLARDLQFDNIIMPNKGGAYFRLSSDDDRNGFVHVKNDGSIQAFVPTEFDDSYNQIGKQLVLCGNKGLEVISGNVTKQNRVIKTPLLEANYTDYPTFIKAKIADLKWTNMANNDYSVFRIGDEMHIVCRFKDDQQRMRLRVGFSGSIFDSESALILVKAMFPITLHVSGGWQINEQCQVEGSDGQRIRAFSLKLPPLRPKAAPVLMHVDQWQSSSEEIWWLRHYWYRLEE